MNYGLKEMNEMEYGLKKVKWNVFIEVDNVTRVELRLIDYVVIWCKPITENNIYDVSKFYRACKENPLRFKI